MASIPQIRGIFMIRLLIFIFILSFFISHNTAQPTSSTINPDNINQLHQQHIIGRGSISKIAYTPDGNQLLVDTSLGLWRYNAQDLSVEPTLTKDMGHFLGYYWGGHYMVFWNEPNIIWIFDGETETLLHEISLPNKKYFNGFSADGQHLIVQFLDESDKTQFGGISLTTGQEIGTFRSEAYSNSLLTPENKRFVISSSQDKGTYWVWDRENKKLSPSFIGTETIWLYDVLFSPDGTRFTINHFGYPVLYNTTTEARIKRVAPYEDFPEMIIAHAFSADSRYLFAAGYNRGTYHPSHGTSILDGSTGDYLDIAIGSASDLIITPNNRYIITSIHREYNNFRENNWYKMGTWEKSFDLAGANILTHPYRDEVILYDNSLQRYEFTSPTPIEDVLLHHQNIQESEVFSPDDRFLLTYSRDAYLWDTQTGEFVRRLPIDTDSRSILFRFSPDGRYLINSTYTGEINVWDIHTGDLLHTVTNYIVSDWGDVYHLGLIGREYTDTSFYYPYQNPYFSPDGNHFISTLINVLYLRDSETGEIIHQQQVSAGDDTIYQARFNPTGTHITIITQKGMMQWWNISTWVMDDVNLSSISPAIISPDGGYVAYGINNEIWLFDTKTGENQLFNNTDEVAITELKFSDDSQFLYSVAEGEVSKWWDIETGDFISSNDYIGTKNLPLRLEPCAETSIKQYCIINIATEEIIFTLTDSFGRIAYAQLNHAGTQIVTRGENNIITLWGIEN